MDITFLIMYFFIIIITHIKIMYKLAADTMILFNGIIFLYNTSKYYGEKKKVCNLDPNDLILVVNQKKYFLA